MDFFKRIEQQLSEKLPFVTYRKPGSDKIFALFQQNDKLYQPKTFSENGFAFAPFDLEHLSGYPAHPVVLFPLEKCRTSETECSNSNGLSVWEAPPISNDTAHLRPRHIQLVESGIAAIESGQLQKVVLSRKQTVPSPETGPAKLTAIFRRMLTRYRTAFVYCWYHPKVGLWLGATPELLFSLHGKEFHTMSLAGTKPYEEGREVNWGKKELAEQQFVTDYLGERLEKMVPTMMVRRQEPVRAGDLVHLHTRISGVVEPRICDVKALIDSLHPTPAVCGQPRDKAGRFIFENEAYDREYYTGFLGELNLNPTKPTTGTQSVFYVNLRCMKVEGDAVHLYMGGGVTKDSSPEEEWQETVYKTQTMLRTLWP